MPTTDIRKYRKVKQTSTDEGQQGVSQSIKSCQICGSNRLESVLFLGYIPPVNTMPIIGSAPEEQMTYPLELLRCPTCTLVQIGYEVAPEILFPPTYPYVSGSTRILRENFVDLYAESSKMLGLNSRDLVIDIGSNDGTLLSNFKNGGHRVLGIEPTDAGKLAQSAGIETEIVFFSEPVARAVRKKYGPAKLITAANVFAHIGGIDSIVEGIIHLLSDDGVFISESHYFPSLIETLQYDTIYHEHLRYYSLGSLKYLFEKHGLEVFHAKKIPSHGGSIRVYTCRKGQRPINSSVRPSRSEAKQLMRPKGATLESFLKQEDAAGITNGSALKTFRTKVIQSKIDLYALLQPLKAAGAKIYGIGAPSRASTLINYVGLNDGIIDCVMEIKTSPKTGKYIPGTRIPVLDESKLFEDQPEYALLFSWHITKELSENLRKKGFKGKFITPLPTPHIL